MTGLNVLCVTRGEMCTLPLLRQMAADAQAIGAEFVVAVDGIHPRDMACRLSTKAYINEVRSRGFIESVLDQAVGFCDDGYVLRLDDDERMSAAMVAWLKAGAYLKQDHWQFPRVHFWGDAHTVLMTHELFPDHQTRLSLKSKSGGRRTVHAGSPFGPGAIAPVAIEHHKFLIRDRKSRLAIAQQYDAQHPGYGTGSMLPFSLPEDAYERVNLVAYGNGTVPWEPDWRRKLTLRHGVPA